jgi:ClpP class serine protease
MNNMPHIASRILNKPLLLEPGYARTFFSALAPRLGIMELHDDEGQILTGEHMRMRADRFNSTRERDRPFQVINGAAILPVSGSLVHKYGHLKPYSGMTGYDGIIARAADAFADPEVKGVMLDQDTPGGEVSGCFDSARKLRQMADAAGKPLWSLCYDMHCSAGMAIASAAHHRLMTASGIAGSVGVVMAHSSYAKKLEKDGMTVTLIHSGAQKVDGNPYQNLPEDVLARFQSETDALRNEFAQMLSDHMSLSVQAILDTEAATYRGQSAINVGFADELINGIDAVSHFCEHLSSRGRTISIGAHMSKSDMQNVDTTTTSPAASETTPDAAVTTDQLKAEATAAAQARIAGILQHAAAKGRESTANHLAFNTQMSVEEAAHVLATIPEPSTQQKMESALNLAMENEEHPKIGPDNLDTENDDKPDQVAQVMSAWNKAKGECNV